MTPPLRKNFILLLIGINLIGLPWIFFANREKTLDFKSASSGKDLPDYGGMPAFRLTERNGNIVTDGTMKGSLWLADFVFTACPNQCPMMTAKFSLLQKTLPVNVRLASFSVDPENDTPEKLRAYAESHGADPKKWLFLTGEKAEITRILSALHLGNGEDPNMHSLRFVLLSPELRVLGYYNTEDSEALGQLKRDIQKWTGSA